MLHIDYETRSEVDLFKEGAFKYAAHPSTDIICMAYAFGDEPVELWHPGLPFPQDVEEALRFPDVASLHAHNAQFERLITQYVLTRYVEIDPPPIEAWYCTAAQARARSLPGGLDDLGACLGLNIQKDKRGKELIKLLSIPQMTEYGDKRLNLDPDPDLLQEMYDYCVRDVEVERFAEQATPPLSEEEHLDWVINERVNDRGLMVDVEFAQAATEYADAELEEINIKISEATAGEITSPRQFQRIKEYMTPYIDQAQVAAAMLRKEKDRKTGEDKVRTVMDKAARMKLLRLVEDDETVLPENVVEMIKLMDEAGKSSVSKYQAMVNRANDADRVQGAYIFSGAGQTGRFSSTGLQLHNFPRGTAPQPKTVRSTVVNGWELDEVMSSLSTMLRPSILAPEGRVLVGGDWSSIEARILPWLSGTQRANKVLDVFRDNDKNPEAPDVYMHAAAGLYQIDPTEVTKEQRAVGKVIILSSGYQGGYRAFQAMARAYRVTVSDDKAADIIRGWRAKNPWCVEFWAGVESAAIAAMGHPGANYGAGRLTYCRPTDTSPLYCQLPSGRILSYPDPKVEVWESKQGTKMDLSCVKAAWKPAAGETDWGRVGLYGGLLAENATQAVAADILRYAMRLCDEDGWPQVGHTHDELILEVTEPERAEALEALEAIMLDVPAWAEGLPLACETWSGRRYGK